MSEVLDAFLPPVRAWFLETFGRPTPPQTLGWPPIQRGEHTLILAPTGSGKTLAAFLWGIDSLYREVLARGEPAKGRRQAEGGVRLLYISPLKALSNDIQRNLRHPLAGIRDTADRLGAPLPRLDVLVRTGDTPGSARQQMARHPPPILITTPESLYLLLTSPLARGMLRDVHTVIVDEIHTLVGNKRGVHLALSLERVVEMCQGRPVQRIGLSATQRPLEEVARFLGGGELAEFSTLGGGLGTADRAWKARPVTIVDAGMVKPVDLKVVTAVDDLSQLPGGSIWPAVIPEVLDLIEAHRTTLVFANSRGQAERTADRLNEVALARLVDGEAGPEALAADGVAKGRGFQGTGAVGGPFRAHHGSVSREARLQLEEALKAGRLPALVGTSSLELGIDIGTVDLVVQLQSPKGVARGLQRVGRSGHLVGQTSVGRIFPTHREDLLECAAVARGMAQGDVEPTHSPQNCLDVLAQQIVAMVSVEEWGAGALLDLVRRAYPYRSLSPALYHSVLDMLSGRYPSTAFRELRARIGWDRAGDRLVGLPGSRLLAVRNGGTITDRGSFAAYLPDRKTRLGELDEEFVFETKPGDVFTLGASTWRVQEVTEDRVVVTPAPGHLPRMPFWRGEAPRRDYHLGILYGRFRRELAQRIEQQRAPEVEEWLRTECNLDARSAHNAVAYVQHQLEVLGAISSDRTIIAEQFTDPLGDLRLVIHSPLGARVNSPWALALAQAFREALGSRPEVMASDDGILFRFVEADRVPPLDIIRSMGPAEARERLLAELPQSAVFGAQFRMNAARALLLPAAKGRQKRTPFWLQRLRAKDLLTAARGFADFPILAETYRDVLRDVLDLEHLEELLRGVQRGEVEVLTAETVVPSPVASGLLYDLIAQYMYEGDQPKAERQMQALLVGGETLSALLDEAALPDLLRPQALEAVEARLQHLSEDSRARSSEELATLFLALGDLSAEEAAERCTCPATPPGVPPSGWLRALLDAGRVVALAFPSGTRYVLEEQALAYRVAFGQEGPSLGPAPGLPSDRAEERDEARRAILRRCLSTHGPLTRDWLLARYPWEPEWLDAALGALVDNGEAVSGRITPGSRSVPPVTEFCDRRNLERIHRQTLALLRKEVEPVSLFDYAAFLARWQHLPAADRLAGSGALARILAQMRGVPAPGLVWERDMLPLRLAAFDPAELAALCEQGELVWAGSGGHDARRARLRFFFRGEGHVFLGPQEAGEPLSANAERVLEFLGAEGASFAADVEAGTGLPALQVGGALVELAMAGLVTNDTLGALRRVLAWTGDSSPAEPRPLSPLQAELATRRAAVLPPAIGHPQSALRRRPVRRSVRAAQRAVGERLERQAVAGWPGRWCLIHRIGVWGRELPLEERVERQARQLLQCYGIVTRQSLEGDPEGGWDWGLLAPQFQLMEMRGEVRRGYFVKGLPGLQFALPEAVERLREWSRPEAAERDDLVLLNASDPANLFGRATDGEAERGPDPSRFARLPSNYVVLQRGRPVLLLELGAQRVTAWRDLPQETTRRALGQVLGHVGRYQRRLVVSAWNGEPVHGSPAAVTLEGLGCYREALAYVWHPSTLSPVGRG